MSIKIMLDPGHFAGYNPGAVAGYYEGTQMWKLYGFLKPCLESWGFTVGCTKDSINDYPKTADGQDNITGRGRMAKGYDLLLSLHSNAAGTPSVDRAVGIYFVDDDCGEIDMVSYDVANLLSKTAAGVMELQSHQVFSKLSTKDRDGDGLKNDDYYGVLYGAHQSGVPGVILKHSFHTNPRAAQWLLSDANLQALAQAEAAALADYYGITQKTEVSVTTGTIYRVRISPNDAASQIGAYANLENAIKKANDNPGYRVYDTTGGLVYASGDTTQDLPEPGIRIWTNGSTRESVYADTAKNLTVGSLNPHESCECLGTVGGMYIVKYQVDGTDDYKVGLVCYHGGWK